jgi:hypothetical protein
MITRRDAVARLAGAASAVLLNPKKASAADLPLRRSLSGLNWNSDEIYALRTAIPAMRSAPRGGKSFWDTLVDLHSGYDQTADWHHHDSWRFLPWHRAYLKMFEDKVRALTDDAFRLPYLDWKDRRIPDIFAQAPFYHAGRNDHWRDTIPVSTDSGEGFALEASPLFDVFFGLAPGDGRTWPESFSHGHAWVHDFVGGDMGDMFYSPRDPLFWFHHAMVDRLFAWWDQRYHGRTDDFGEESLYQTAWLDDELPPFKDANGAPVQVRAYIKPADYAYDTLGGIVFFGPAPGRSHVEIYDKTFAFGGSNGQSAALALPEDLVRLVTHHASNVRLTAKVETEGTASVGHRIAISLLGPRYKSAWSLFGIPMGAMAMGDGRAQFVADASSVFGNLLSAGPDAAASGFSLQIASSPYRAKHAGKVPEIRRCQVRIRIVKSVPA